MIIYIADPMELLGKQEEKKQLRTKLPSGGYLIAERMESEQWKVVDICSTDPMDYMSKKYYPGAILDVKL
ncbi:MAG: hypothetical protein GX119_10070 [Syntrophomonadaceae bacterium]|nr:hypothetical protein [Syntrophomonadaceae bacterium]